METLVACAIKIGEDVFSLPPPARWDDILGANRDKITRENYRTIVREGWYLTSTGRFIPGAEAEKLAEANGQRLFEKGGPGYLDPIDLGW